MSHASSRYLTWRILNGILLGERAFCQASSLNDNCENFSSPAASPKYGQISFQFLIVNYVIAMGPEMRRGQNGRSFDDRAEINIVYLKQNP